MASPKVGLKAWMAATLLLLMMSIGRCIAQHLCENCNCQISASKEGSQAIYNMRLLCRTGSVTWFGASGGILLELTPFIHGNFRACFRTESDENTHIKVSQETSHISRHANYKLNMEEAVSFKLKHLLTSNKKSKEFCVDSRTKDPLLMYIEAVRTPGVGAVPKVIFHYDMEELASSLPSNSMDDCRPCTKEELLDAYCTMDFAVIGSISDVTDTVADDDKTDISVKVKQVIHQTQPSFFTRVKRSDPHLTGSVLVPKKCRIQKDEGEFLLSGRVKLGRLMLKCAPYLHEWRQIQHEVECTYG